MNARRDPLRFAPYEQLGGAPNVVVDGSPTEGTVLTLSHWPHTPCPPGLERDLSAEMAVAYLDRFDLHGTAELVSNNHFDQDGLVSIFALVNPDWTAAHRELLIDIAAAGDFATYRDRTAARVSMAIAAYADPARSPIAAAAEIAGDYGAWTATLYGELLDQLIELCEQPQRFERLWAEEDAALTASEEEIISGRVMIDEVPALDLAVLQVPTTAPDYGGHRFGSRWVSGLHPMAVNNATERFAVMTLRDRSYEFAYRYETWVQYRSRPLRQRVDLGPLAEELSAEEPGEARWTFDGVADIIPALHLVGADESALSAERFRRRVEGELATAAPAWDPLATL